MVEFIFILVFGACLLVTGLTMVGALVAAGVALLVLLMLSLFGVVFKLLPWIIVIALAIWAYRHYQQIPR